MGHRVSIWFAVFVFALIASSISAEEAESKEHVLTLDHSNFDDVVGKHEFIVVEFYAPWCGHCKKLAPEYEKAASILSSHDPAIVLAKIDASDEANRVIGTQHEIQGFPTLKIFRNGGKGVQDYKGPREADGIVDYLKKQSGPASAEIKSTEDANNLITDKNIVIVGVFPKFAGEEFDNYTALAEKLRSDYEFGHTSDVKHLPRGDSSVDGPFIRLFKPFDELVADVEDFNLDTLEKFVGETSTPTVTIFDKDPNNHPFVVKFFNGPNAKAMLFMNFTDEVANSLKTKYGEVAKQYKGKGLSFLVGDLDASQGAFQYFGLKEEQVPLIIIQTNDGQKYLKPNVEPDQVASWITDYKDGNVPPYKKSEPIPEMNDEPVKVVVADSLQDIVFNSGKNVLLEIYAPWCGHCKKLAPILDEVAVSYESDPDVVIAKLDGTANDIPGDAFQVQGYPTLYFRSASGKLTQYDGDRTKEAFIEYIEKSRDNKTAAQKESVSEEPIKETVSEEPKKDEL